MQMKKLVAFLVLFSLIPIVNVYGAIVRLDLDTLWTESGIDTQRGARGMIYRIIIIQVEDHFIQPSNMTTVRVRIEGGEIGNMGVWVEDQPEFHVGEHVFVFLYKPEEVEGDYEFLVYGSVQGKFSVHGAVATSITGESFTIPEPEDTMRDTTPPPMEETTETPDTPDIDSYIMITAVIAIIGALVLNWVLQRQ